ncbi:MAG: ribosome-associated translation inhibitor RaiA [Deltaproteobacteria bacterium]|nr:MAG: ribosome-associated translation inhibitor RaiA [Deltaproteobacteria bacterium]
MKVPLEISTRNVDLTDDLNDLVREKAEKLDTFCDEIIACRIMVEVPHRSQRKGVSYNVRIDISVPGGELVVKREPNEDLYVAIVKAFDVAERQIKEFVGKHRGEVKVHFERPVARVTTIFPTEGYGFLTAPDGREIYFHENALLNGKFEELVIGVSVAFVEHMGDKGPQASSVTLL